MSNKKVSIRIGAGANFQESVVTDVQEAKTNASNAVETANSVVSQLAEITQQNDIKGFNLAKVGMVLKKGSTGTWNSNMVESPCVWFDEKYQRYGMVFVGYADDGSGNPITPKIGLAWSNDLLTWTEAIQSPIFGGSGVAGTPDRVGTSGPVLYVENGTYYLFYIGLDGVGYEAGNKSVCVATSTDLFNWTRYANNPVITPAGTGWRKDAVWHVSIVKHKGKYYNFFNATSNNVERIGYAVSDNLFDWQVKDDDSPLIDVGASGTWESLFVGDPSVYKVGNTWYMAYYGTNGTNAQDGLSYTSEEQFPLGWTKYHNNPILKVGQAGTYDEYYAHKPYIFRTPQAHFHFYTAVGAPFGRGIALALDKTPFQMEYSNMITPETSRTITTTSLAPVSQTGIIFDTNKTGLEMRISARGVVDTGQQITIKEAMLSGVEVVMTNTVWGNVQSEWVSVVNMNGIKDTNINASITGGTGQIALILYEFRWLSV